MSAFFVKEGLDPDKWPEAFREIVGELPEGIRFLYTGGKSPKTLYRPRYILYEVYRAVTNTISISSKSIYTRDTTKNPYLKYYTKLF